MACSGAGVIGDSGPAPAPPGDERGYLARKPCGCAVRWISYSISGEFVTASLAEWRTRGWTVEDGLQSEIAKDANCTHGGG